MIKTSQLLRISFWWPLTVLFLIMLSGTTHLRAEPITIICNTDNPKNSPHVFTLERFGALVHEYSSGRLRAEIHFRGNEAFPAIGGEEVNVNMVMFGQEGAQGIVHATVVAAGNAAQKIPPLNFLMMPYIFKDLESARKLFSSDFMTGEFNEQIARKYRVRVIGWLIGGFRHLTNSVRPVTRLADLQGLKIRLPRSRVMVSAYEALGAQVYPLNWGDVHDALKNGSVDGQENPFSVIAYSRFWEDGQKYITTNGTFLWTGPILISETFLQSLPRDLREIVLRAGLEAARAEWAWIDRAMENAIGKIQRHGMIIQDLEDRPEWEKRTRPVWERHYAWIGDSDPGQGQTIIRNVLDQMR